MNTSRIIAERLSARHLILQHALCQCMCICIFVRHALLRMLGWGRGACAIARGRRPYGTRITAEATYSEPWMRRNDIFRAMDDVFHIMLHHLIFTSIFFCVGNTLCPYDIARVILCALCVYLYICVTFPGRSPRTVYCIKCS